MALDILEANVVSEGAALAKQIVKDLYPVMQRLNVLYDAAGGVKDTLTQGDLDTVPGWAGITKQQVDDGMFVLTSTLREAIASGYTQLAKLAARG